MPAFSPELDHIGGVLQRVAVERAREHRLARGRRRNVSLLATCTALFATAAALAGGVDLRSVLPGYSIAQTPVVSPEQVVASLSPPVSPQALGAVRLISNVDLSQLHEARSAHLGVTVLVAPRTTGGACAIFIQTIATTTQCGDAAALERGMPIINDEATLYVGMRPDGVSTVTAVDGTSVPVTDNVFISDKPIEP
jgi:hypothetical protein